MAGLPPCHPPLPPHPGGSCQPDWPGSRCMARMGRSLHIDSVIRPTTTSHHNAMTHKNTTSLAFRVTSPRNPLLLGAIAVAMLASGCANMDETQQDTAKGAAI